MLPCGYFSFMLAGNGSEISYINEMTS